MGALWPQDTPPPCMRSYPHPDGGEQWLGTSGDEHGALLAELRAKRSRLADALREMDGDIASVEAALTSPRSTASPERIRRSMPPPTRRGPIRCPHIRGTRPRRRHLQPLLVKSAQS
jgi:hypothetical protein